MEQAGIPRTVSKTLFGRRAEASKESERACQLDPLSVFVIANAGLGAYRARDYDRAIQLLQRAIALDPNLPMGHTMIALVYVQQGAHAQALRASAKAVELGGGGAPWKGLYAYVCAATGERATARRLLGELENRP